jgi:hypothetical protein
MGSLYLDVLELFGVIRVPVIHYKSALGAYKSFLFLIKNLVLGGQKEGGEMAQTMCTHMNKDINN